MLALILLFTFGLRPALFELMGELVVALGLLGGGGGGRRPAHAREPARGAAAPRARGRRGLTARGGRRVHCPAVFDALSDRLQATLGDLRGRGRLDEEAISRAMREIRLALLEADVNFRVVKDFVAHGARARARPGRPEEPDARASRS